MIRCPLCGVKVHENWYGVPDCGTPGCGDGPVNVEAQRLLAELKQEIRQTVEADKRYQTPADEGPEQGQRAQEERLRETIRKINEIAQQLVEDGETDNSPILQRMIDQATE